MTSYARLKPFYVSLSVRNKGSSEALYDSSSDPDNTIEARVSTVFNSPIVEKASDFVIAIERMELSLNGVPFYDASDDSVSHNIVVRSRANPFTVFSAPVVVDLNAYSLSHLFEILNSYTFQNPITLADINVTFSLSADGFIVFKLLDPSNFDDIYFDFPRRLNQILGISTVVQLVGYSECQSTFPRIDLGDDLDHIILRTDLPTYSDSLGNVKLPVLTDFAPPSQYSNSLTYGGADNSLVESGFVTNIRQKVIYNPSERRYLELIGDFPVTNITIDAYYVNSDEVLKKVLLPLGGIFELKIGFYLRQ